MCGFNSSTVAPNDCRTFPSESCAVRGSAISQASEPRWLVGILDRMRNGSPDDLIFPNPEGGVFSENAMLAVLNRLGFGHVTVHGFRLTFATWAEEATDYPEGVRESALAHQYKCE
jgi:integrase